MLLDKLEKTTSEKSSERVKEILDMLESIINSSLLIFIGISATYSALIFLNILAIDILEVLFKVFVTYSPFLIPIIIAAQMILKHDKPRIMANIVCSLDELRSGKIIKFQLA